MNTEPVGEERICPKCHAITPLPFMCRRCWSGLSLPAKIAVYHAAGQGNLRRAVNTIPMVQP